jgi:hypothetical protein
MTLAPIHHSICTTCRLRSLVAAKQYARARTPTSRDWTRSRQPTFVRYLHTSRISSQQQNPTRQEDLASSSNIKQSTESNQTLDKKLQAEDIARQAEEDFELEGIDTTVTENGANVSQSIEALNASPEDVARAARQRFGDALPEDLLNDKQYAAYERLYGPPVGKTRDEMVDLEENELEGELDETDNVGTGILKENEDGMLEEVEYVEEEEFDEEEEQELVEEDAEGVTEEDPEADLDAQTIRDLAALRVSPELLDDSEEQFEAPYDHTRAHPLTGVGCS